MLSTQIITNIKTPVKINDMLWKVEYKKCDCWEKKFFIDVSRAYAFYSDTKRQIACRQHFNER